MSLPSGYKRLEYIQSTGTQYIDTGFTPNSNTRIVADFQIVLNNTNYIAVFGQRSPSGQGNFLFLQSGLFIAMYGSAYSTLTNSTSVATNRHVCDFDKNIVTISGASKTLTSSSFTGVANLVLFACNTSGNKELLGTTRFYSCQIYDNSTIIRDFIPCKKPDGTIGLWDDVNSVFYGNAGTGTFTAGSVVDPYGNDKNTLLLLHGEDLADSSPYNKSITNNGVSISSAQSKFGGKSLYFNGSSNLSIDLPVTGDMTVDFWAYIQDSSISFPTPFGWDYNGNRCNYVHTKPSVTWFAQNDGRDSIEVSTNGIAHNAWHHIALVRSGKQMLGFIDGVLKTTSSVNYGNNDTLSIGVLNAAKSATWFTGFIDEFRVSSIARWTVDFTPPSKPYSSSLNLPVNIGGTWKKANEAFVNIGGTWKTVKDAFVNIGGAWKKIG